MKLIKDYEKNYPLHKKFSKKLVTFLDRLLASNNLCYLQIEKRVKTFESYLDKAHRLYMKNKQADGAIDDIVGIRIITYHNSDVEDIAHMVEKEFVVHSKNSEYETKNRKPNYFGYSSTHYKVSLSEKYIALNNWQHFQDIIFEIQIRTVAQHAWASIDHKLRYKAGVDIPDDIQREIFQLSALFELADNTFFQVKNKLEQLNRDELEKYKQRQPGVKLNVQTLAYFLQQNLDVIEEMEENASQIGFKESWLRHDPNSIHELVKFFKRLEIETMDEMEELFLRVVKKAPEIMERLYDVISDEKILYFNRPFPVLMLVIVLLKLKNVQELEMVVDEEIARKLEQIPV